MQMNSVFTRLNLTFTILAVVYISSCIPQKWLIYLQDKLDAKYTLKPGDILYIRVMITNRQINELWEYSIACNR